MHKRNAAPFYNLCIKILLLLIALAAAGLLPAVGLRNNYKKKNNIIVRFPRVQN